MFALIIKDISTLKKTLVLTLIICICLGGYGIYEDMIFMVPLICAMIPLILSAISFGYDTASGFEQFAFSMPVKRSSYVLSKLFFSVAFGVVGAIAVFIMLSLKGGVTMGFSVLMSVLTLMVCVLIAAVQLPFILKYGAEKGKLIMVITYFAIFALSTLLKDKTSIITNIMKLFNDYSIGMIGFGVILLGSIFIWIAIRISIHVMIKKEY